MVKKNKRQNDKKLRNLNFKFRVVEYIKDNNILPTWLNSKASMNYYTKPLKQRGIITNPEKSIWYVDWDKWEAYYVKEVKKISDKIVKKSSKGTHPIVRGHGYQFYLKIPKRILWTERTRKRFIEKTNLANRKKENGVYKIRVLGHKVWFCEGGIIVYFPESMDFRADNARECEQMAIYEFNKVITRISNLIKQDLTHKGKYIFTIDKQHYADVEHELAIAYNDRKEKFKVIGDDGKVWLLIDFSNKTNEFEYINSQTAKIDRDDKVNPTFNDMRENPDQVMLPSEITSNFSKLLKVISEQGNLINGITNNQKVFDANMMSHIKAVQDLSAGVRLLTKKVEELGKLQNGNKNTK
jgi:hypothetical protein